VRRTRAGASRALGRLALPPARPAANLLIA
jgi:hypothetical protein